MVTHDKTKWGRGVDPGALLLRSTVSFWTTPGDDRTRKLGDPSLIAQPSRWVDSEGYVENGCRVSRFGLTLEHPKIRSPLNIHRFRFDAHTTI
ncbi:hypothetical protein TNCV_903851 [Trichonephila clavipes]|nr:hypothetical protein TNCV_903851 [Trichonephila clavipes]